MEQENRKELSSKLGKCKQELIELRKELTALNEEKEKLFKAKNVVSQQIRALIGDVKDSRIKRDEFTTGVKGSKEKRRELNDNLRAKISEIKKLDSEKKALMRKHKITTDPSMIKKQIDSLELKIETEAPAFKEEQRLMKMIKILRVQYEQAKAVSGIFEKAHALSKEIDELRKGADEVHKKIQTSAKTSQEKHEEMIHSSKEIRELHRKEKEALDLFLAAKAKFSEAYSRFKQKQQELDSLRAEEGKVFEGEVKERKQSSEQILRQKTREVEEKIRKGQKLTTEDLLVMQGGRE